MNIHIYIHFHDPDISVPHHPSTYNIWHIDNTEASTAHAKSHIRKCDEFREGRDHIGLLWSEELQERDETNAESCQIV